MKENPAQGMQNPVRLLRLEEAALYLGRSPHTVRQMVYQRVFPVIKASEKSRMWLDIRDLDAWISSEKRYL